MTEKECWETLIWERQADVPARKAAAKLRKNARWRIPKYPNQWGLGVVYRIQFQLDSRSHTYIGIGKDTARERIQKHLGKNEKFVPQRMMSRRIDEAGALDVWTMSQQSTASIGKLVIDANFQTRFNRLLFEAAAVAFVERRFPAEVLLNSAESQPYRTSRIPSFLADPV